MSDVPDDVLSVAYDIADGNHSEDETCRLIAEAIMAERERCAKIAEQYGDNEVTDTRDIELMIQQVAAQEAAYEIVDLTRKGVP